MIVQPSSNLILYKDVRIAAGEEIAFPSKSAQQAYFASKKVLTVTDMTYVRKTGSIKIEAPTSTVSQCNFLSFTNPSFENIVFYAYIVDYEYISNVTSEIFYEIDYFQTFMFDMQVDPCNILRQHMSQKGRTTALSSSGWDQSKDELMELYTPESLPISDDMYATAFGSDVELIAPARNEDIFLVLQVADFNVESIESYQTFKENFNLVVNCAGQVTYQDAIGTQIIDGITDLSGTVPRSFNLYIVNSVFTIEEKRQAIFNWLELNGLTSSVLGTYMMYQSEVQDMLKDIAGITESFSIDYPSLIDPKLMRYPYSFIRVQNTSGQYKDYKYEDFLETRGDNVDFKTGVICDSAPYRTIIPRKYKISDMNENGFTQNVSERIDSPTPLQMSYVTDSYLTFLSAKYQEMAQVTDAQNLLQSLKATDAGAWVVNMGTALDTGFSIMGNVMSAGGYNTKNPSGGAGLLQNANSLIPNPLPTFAQNFDSGAAYQNLRQDHALRKMSDYELLTGQRAVPPFGGARNAFVQGNYHASTLDGSVPYHLSAPEDTMSPMSFAVIKRHLKDFFMTAYEKYFDLYGYTCGRYDVPLVVNWIKGVVDEAKIPDWRTVGDETQTYVQTADMKVFGIPSVACRYIETLFNGGCIFKKGADA